MNKKWINSFLAAALTLTSLTVTANAEGEAIDHLGRNGTYSASNQEQTTEADKAFDGLFGQGHRWGTPTYTNLKEPQWVQVDFKEAKSVKEFKITFEDRSSEEAVKEAGTNVLKYHIEVKKEGQDTFETVFTKNTSVKRVEEVSLSESHKVTAVKLVVEEIADTSWDNVNVEEFEIYGDRNIETTNNKNHMLGATVTVSSTEHEKFDKKYINDGDQSTGTSQDELQAYREKRWASGENENTAAWVNAVFKKPTQVSEVRVNLWRDAAPLDSQVKAFNIEYVDQNDETKTVKVTNKKLQDKDGYEDLVIYQFATPVVMKSMKIKDFDVVECEYNNISIEEIEVFSNKQEAAADIEQRPDVNHMRQATMTVSSQEVDSFTADKLNNGIKNDNKGDRWASKENTYLGEWVNAAFEKATKVQQVDFYLFTRDVEPMPSNISSFDVVFTLQDGQERKETVTNKAQGNGFAKFVQLRLDTPVIAKSMKVENFKVSGDQYPNVSINEIELYSNKHDTSVPTTLEGVVASIKGSTIAAGTTKFALPEVPAGFEVVFNGCDLEQIVDGKLNIHQPLVDKEVKINFDVKDTKTGKTKNTGDISYIIKGQHTVDESKNDKPVVIPEIQEWYSNSTEKVALDTLTTVVYNDDSLKAIVEEFVADYKDFTGKTLTVEKGTAAKAGAFYFEKTDALAYLGEEGYEMDIQADKVVVKAGHVTGNMYAMQTIHQMYKQDATGYSVGTMHDYPRFAVRGLLLDVARKPVSLEMMKEITRTMRYYKMNDFQAHLSDNYIFLEQYGKHDKEDEAFKAYEAFRLESSLKNDKGETPTAKDYAISKAEFKQFILDERALGMRIVPEIDVPAHATSFTKVWPELAVHNAVVPNNKNRPLVDHFDLTKKEAKDKIKEIFDDYTKDGTFDSETTIHIGADEFLYNATSYRTWLNEIVPYVKNTNTVRMWGGLTWIDDHKTQISKEAIEGVEMNLWSCDWASGIDMYNMGYKVINTIDDFGYMVPNGSYGRQNAYGDLLNVNRIFNDFEVNKVRNRGGRYQYVPSGDDQVLGAAFAIWSDNIDKQASGLTESDLYWRFFDALPYYAEKTWAATGKEKGTSENLANIAQAKGTGPNTNPYYQEDKAGEAYESYDFASMKDGSENGRDLTDITNAKVENGVLDLDAGESFVKTPMKQLGNGHSLAFDFRADTPYNVGDILFEASAPYGTHDIRVMDDGRLGFTRELYDYYFDYKLPVGKDVHIEITTEQQKTKLYVNGEFISDASGRFFHENMVKKSGIMNATFALPLERIGSKTQAIDAVIDNVIVKDLSEKDPGTAFDQGKENWTATADSETIANLPKEGEIAKAFDSNAGTHWHSNWKGATDKVPTMGGKPGEGKGADGSIWTEVMFGAPKTVNQVSFTPRTDSASGYVTKASLFVKPVSAGEDEWVEVAHEQVFANSGAKKTFEFPRQEIAGFKFVAHESNDGWVTVSEFDINDLDRDLHVYTQGDHGTITVDKDVFTYGDKITVKAVPEAGYDFAGWYDAVLDTKVSDEATYTFTLAHNTALEARFVPNGQAPVVDRTALDAAIKAAKDIDRSKYTEESLALLDQAVKAGEALGADATQAQVDAATGKITKAIAELKPIEVDVTKPADKTALEALIKKAEAIKADGYTAESFEKLADALTSAKAVYANKDVTQEQVDGIADILKAAIDGLVKEGETQTPSTPTNPSNPQQPTTPDAENKPATGDSTSIVGLFMMASLAAAGIYVSMKAKKEEQM